MRFLTVRRLALNLMLSRSTLGTNRAGKDGDDRSPFLGLPPGTTCG